MAGGGHAGLGEASEQGPRGLEGSGTTRGDGQVVWLEHKVMGAPSFTFLPSRLGALRLWAGESKRCFGGGSCTIWQLIWKDSFGVSVKR